MSAIAAAAAAAANAAVAPLSKTALASSYSSPPQPAWLTSFYQRRRKLLFWALLHMVDVVSDVLLVLSFLWHGELPSFTAALLILVISRLATTSYLVGRAAADWVASPRRTLLVLFDLYPLAEAARLLRRPASAADAMDALSPAFAHPSVFFLEAVLESLPQTLMQATLSVAALLSSTATIAPTAAAATAAAATATAVPGASSGGGGGLWALVAVVPMPPPAVGLAASLFFSLVMISLTLTDLELGDARHRTVLDARRLRQGLADARALALMAFRAVEAFARSLTLGLGFALLAALAPSGDRSRPFLAFTGLPAAAAAVVAAVPGLPQALGFFGVTVSASSSGAAVAFSLTFVVAVAAIVIVAVNVFVLNKWLRTPQARALVASSNNNNNNKSAHKSSNADTDNNSNSSSQSSSRPKTRSRSSANADADATKHNSLSSGDSGNGAGDGAGDGGGGDGGRVTGGLRPWMHCVYLLLYWEKRLVRVAADGRIAIASVISARRYYAFRAGETALLLVAAWHLIPLAAAATAAAAAAAAAAHAGASAPVSGAVGEIVVDVSPLSLVHWLLHLLDCATSPLTLLAALLAAARTAVAWPATAISAALSTATAPAPVRATVAATVSHSVSVSMSTLWLVALAASAATLLPVAWLIGPFQWFTPPALAAINSSSNGANANEVKPRLSFSAAMRQFQDSTMTTPQRHLLHVVAPDAVREARERDSRRRKPANSNASSANTITSDSMTAQPTVASPASAAAVSASGFANSSSSSSSSGGVAVTPAARGRRATLAPNTVAGAGIASRTNAASTANTPGVGVGVASAAAPGTGGVMRFSARTTGGAAVVAAGSSKKAALAQSQQQQQFDGSNSAVKALRPRGSAAPLPSPLAPAPSPFAPAARTPFTLSALSPFAPPQRALSSAFALAAHHTGNDSAHGNDSGLEEGGEWTDDDTSEVGYGNRNNNVNNAGSSSKNVNGASRGGAYKGGYDISDGDYNYDDDDGDANDDDDDDDVALGDYDDDYDDDDGDYGDAASETSEASRYTNTSSYRGISARGSRGDGSNIASASAVASSVRAAAAGPGRPVPARRRSSISRAAVPSASAAATPSGGRRRSSITPANAAAAAAAAAVVSGTGRRGRRASDARARSPARSAANLTANNAGSRSGSRSRSFAGGASSRGTTPVRGPRATTPVGTAPAAGAAQRSVTPVRRSRRSSIKGPWVGPDIASPRGAKVKW